MPDAAGTETGKWEPCKGRRFAAQAIKSAAAQAVKSGAPGTIAQHILQGHRREAHPPLSVQIEIVAGLEVRDSPLR